MNETAFFNLLNEEMAAKKQLMTVNLDAGYAMALASALNLALRHPRVHPDSVVAVQVSEFIKAIREYLSDCPASLMMLEAGMDPTLFDVK